MKVSTILNRKKRLILLRDKFEEYDWCQYNYAKDVNGNKVSLMSNSANCYCLSGLLMKLYLYQGNIYHNMLDYLTQKVREYTSYETLISFNDADKTTKQDILNFLNRVINDY